MDIESLGSNSDSSDQQLLFCAGLSLKTALVKKYLLVQGSRYFTFNLG